MIIDTHIHIFADNIAKRASERLIDVAKIPCYTDFTEAQTRKKLNEWGIDLGVVLPIATKPSQQRTINDWAATLQHGNLISFGSVHPFADNVLQELKYIKNLGLYGVKLHPDYQDFFVDDENVFKMYEAMETLELPVVFHTGFDPLSPDVVHATPERLLHVHQAFPKLKIIAAHMGDNMRYDDAEKYLIGKDIYIDISFTADHCELKQFERMIKNHGADKVLFASDCPWNVPTDELRKLGRAHLSPDDMDLILYKNAAKLLKLDI